MMRRSKGFTLIELMIVIAIIGILASLAVSAYQTYVVRAEVSEGIAFAASAKAAIVDFYMSTGSAPATGPDAGLPDPAEIRGSYVSRMDVSNGRVDVMFGNQAHPDINGKTLSLTPYVTASHTVIWRCGRAPQPEGTPMPDENGTPVTDQPGSLDPRYLPSTCR